MTDKKCIYAWRGCHIQPNGKVTPCCLVDSMGDSTVEDIDYSRNNKNWKQLRQDLLSGIENPVCNRCWEDEKIGKRSMRQIGNNGYSYIWDQISIIDTGELSDNFISLWDIRDTNLCNMKCIMCDPGYSSLINQEAIKNYSKVDGYTFRPKGTQAVQAAAPDQHLRSYIIPKLDNQLATMYFAGGEPLISKLHWDILEYLIENNNTNVVLTYNTNMLKLNHFGKNIIDLWKHFKKVHIGASIDAVGKRAEYARFGTDWKTIDDNFKKLSTSGLDNIVLGLNSTQSWYTIGGLIDLIDWVEQFDINHVALNPARFDHNVEINLLPMDIREKIIELVDNRIKDDSRFSTWKFLKYHMTSETYDQNQLEKYRKRAINFTNTLDRIRQNSLLIAAPELESIIKDW